MEDGDGWGMVMVIVMGSKMGMMPYTSYIVMVCPAQTSHVSQARAVWEEEDVGTSVPHGD